MVLITGWSGAGKTTAGNYLELPENGEVRGAVGDAKIQLVVRLRILEVSSLNLKEPPKEILAVWKGEHG